MKKFVLALALLISFGCTSVPDNFVFNGNSSKSIQSDINTLLKKLPRNKKQEFLMALLAIQFSDVNSVYDMIDDPAMSGMNYDILSKKLDGLTYGEVIELAATSKTQVKVLTN